MNLLRIIIGSIALLSFEVGCAQVFQGTPPADWVAIEGTTSIKVSKEETIDKETLIKLAQQEAIEKKFGTSIVYGNFMKMYEGDLEQREHYIDLSSQFPQGVWKADMEEPVITSAETEMERATRRGRVRKMKGTEWTCQVKGYAQPMKQILPQFEFKIQNGKKNVVVEQQIKNGTAELIAGTDSVFRQGDLFITHFRSTRSGHLVLFMDNGSNAFRMLPYAAFDKDDDVRIEANRWHKFFDLSAVPVKEQATVDELELRTDLQYDAIRIYYLFSETPFTKDFFFTMSEDSPNPEEGYSSLPSITSQQFATWLQQNKVRKSDLQVSVVDLIIDNVNQE